MGRDIHHQMDLAENNIDALYTEHSLEWEKMWNNAEIIIKGDDKAQVAVNFSIYHLLRAANSQDSRVAICAKGFSGEAYFGHYFWDTEIYLLPFFIHTDLQEAKALAEFRINTLEGAKQNAKAAGYNGARYAWESSLSGIEQCPNWQYADHEVHITADVVFGLWHYYKAACNDDFIVKALPVFIETAKYWIERAEMKEDGTINLNGVMGPDEYICLCNNNAYTNFMVSYSLMCTIEAAQIVKRINPSAFESIGVLEEELERFRIIAEGLPIHKINPDVISQCDGFENFEELDFAKIWPDRSTLFGSCVSQERNYRSKALKQADVLLLPFLFPSVFTKKQIKANFEYYYPYTTHDSSLSAIIHSIICCSIDKPQEAYDLFCRSIAIDLDEKKAGAAEGIHIATCGGIWQAVIFGFAGMNPDFDSDNPEFYPKLPEKWESLQFNTVYKGEHLRVIIDRKKTRIERGGFIA